MTHDEQIEELYKEGNKPMMIAYRLGLTPEYVRGRVQRMRHAGIITNYTRGGRDPNYTESTARQIYLQKKLKVGSISKLLDHMSPEVQDYFVSKCINDQYQTLSELFADELIELYFERKKP